MIPYIGSKSKYSKYIIPYIPLNILTYCEPFGGMFSTFFDIDKSLFSNTKFVYNDINYLNYNLINYLQLDIFIDYINNFKVDEEAFNISLELISDSSDFMKAISWLVILTCSNNKLNLLKSKYDNDSNFEILKFKLNQNNEFKLINSVNNMQYQDIINNYDSTDTFFYLDPPYLNTEYYYHNHNFVNKESHIELSNILKNIKGKFLLSYVSNDFITSLYKDFKIVPIGNNINNEILISN